MPARRDAAVAGPRDRPRRPPAWNRARSESASRLPSADRILGLVDELFDLVLGVTHGLLGLARPTIDLAFTLEFRVVGEPSDRRFDAALHLIQLSTHGCTRFSRFRTAGRRPSADRASFHRGRAGRCGAGFRAPTQTREQSDRDN